MNAIALAFALLLALALTGGQGLPKPAPVRGQGCVQTGAEPRCLMLKDRRSGIFYSLLVKGARPKMGAGIDFTACRTTVLLTACKAWPWISSGGGAIPPSNVRRPSRPSHRRSRPWGGGAFKVRVRRVIYP